VHAVGERRHFFCDFLSKTGYTPAIYDIVFSILLGRDILVISSPLRPRDQQHHHWYPSKATGSLSASGDRCQLATSQGLLNFCRTEQHPCSWTSLNQQPGWNHMNDARPPTRAPTPLTAGEVSRQPDRNGESYLSNQVQIGNRSFLRKTLRLRPSKPAKARESSR
jgi:hypothetical protein